MIRVSALCCAIAVSPVMAADKPPPEHKAPDMALLEFLGEWEGGNGQWLDPKRFEQAMDKEARKRRQKAQDHD